MGLTAATAIEDNLVLLKNVLGSPDGRVEIALSHERNSVGNGGQAEKDDLGGDHTFDWMVNESRKRGDCLFGLKSWLKKKNVQICLSLYTLNHLLQNWRAYLASYPVGSISTT